MFFRNYDNTTTLCPIYIDLAIRLKVVLYLLILEKRCRGVTLSQRFRQCILFQTLPIVGIFFGNGAIHDSNRKLALLTMRDLGVGKKTLEERIQEEAWM